MPEAGRLPESPWGAATGRPLLEVEGLARYFRVATPWVERAPVRSASSTRSVATRCSQLS